MSGPEPGSASRAKLGGSSPMPEEASLSASRLGPSGGESSVIICCALEITAFTKAFSHFSSELILFAQSIASSREWSSCSSGLRLRPGSLLIVFGSVFSTFGEFRVVDREVGRPFGVA